MLSKINYPKELSKITTLKMLFIIMLYSINTQAQNTSFNCDHNAYLFQHNDVFAIDLASGSSMQVAEDIIEENINGVAYNPKDGYIWGAISGRPSTIVRIGKDFKTSTYYIDSLPDINLYVGDINHEGVFHVKGSGSTYYTIDLDSTSSSYTKLTAKLTLSKNISIHDWAFNAVDNKLYAVERATNILYRIDPINGKVEELGEVSILSGLNYSYGAVYFDKDGRFYLSANQTGTIYVIQEVQNISTIFDIESNIFAFGPSSTSNDGARCPTASVLQEICDNGIDDDEDGLIDCEDPSCSGYGLCDTIEPPTSSSNNGGLESNSRLSEKINKRNYNRVRTGFKFNHENASRIKKNENYGLRNPNSEFELQDFIPLEIINEEETIEATPSDLIDITNAVDVYSVDYIKEQKAIASVLILKTESGVYEHTKHICDRLLGAELLSVSTINIKGKRFIKSIIKNVDGTIEFVLSLSARTVDKDSHFIVDSHWNLDQYEEKETYYNFQIWSNNIDDLYKLGDEVLNLLDAKKTIVSYSNSEPPAVFVKKGAYRNGNLFLEIINTNRTEKISFDAGYRLTETSEFESLNKSIELNGEYLTAVQIKTGSLFDIGFRIRDHNSTPDDIFMSDGPWGIDASNGITNVIQYQVSKNENTFDEDVYVIERNVQLSASTDSYFAAHRTLTPRYNTVDLSAFNSFNFLASGIGTLEITLLKKSIENWDDQYKTYIELTENEVHHQIPLNRFKSLIGEELVLEDLVSIVFTMVSETGDLMTMKMDLKDLNFSYQTVLSAFESNTNVSELYAFPNPMSEHTNIQFDAKLVEPAELILIDQIGREIRKINLVTNVGKNSVRLDRKDLRSGLYFVRIKSKERDYNSMKLIVK